MGRASIIAVGLLALIAVGVVVVLDGSRETPRGQGDREVVEQPGPEAPREEDRESKERAGSAPRCSVAVLVVDARSGKAVPGARVRIHRNDPYDSRPLKTAGTDDAGRVSWRGLEGRSFLLVAEHPGRVRADEQVALQQESPGEHDLGTMRIELALGISMECLVRQGTLDGPPVPGLSVLALEGGWIRGEGGTEARRDLPLATGTSGADGRVRLTGIPPKSVVTLLARADGWTEASRVVRAPAAERRSATVLVVTKASTVRGVVHGPDGKPAAGVPVYAVPAPYRAMLADPAAPYDDPETWDAEEVLALRATTDPTGRYAVRRLLPGVEYLFLATKGDRLASRLSAARLAPPAGDEAELNLRLESLRELRLAFRGPSGPVDAGDLQVELRPLDDARPVPEPEFTEKGGLSYPGVHAGSYELEVAGEGVPVQSTTIRVLINGPAEMVVQVDPGCVISGTVVDERGKPAPAARIVATSTGKIRDRVVSRMAKSDAEGRYTVDGLPQGNYRLSAHGGGVVSDPVEVRAPATNVRLAARRLAVIRFTLACSSGPVREEPSVMLTDGSGTVSFPSASRDEAGRWVIPGVFPGPQRLVLRTPSYAPYVATLQVQPGQELVLGEIRLDTGFALRGRVVDPAGGPVAAAIVGPVWDPEAARTDRDGGFLLKQLPKGRSLLQVAAAGFLTDAFEVVVPGAHGEILLSVGRGGRVRGRIAADAGMVRRLIVRGRGIGDPAGFRRFDVRPDAQGRFEARIHAGQVRLEVFDGETSKAVVTVTVREGADHDVVIPVR